MSNYLDSRNQAVTLDYDELDITCPIVYKGTKGAVISPNSQTFQNINFNPDHGNTALVDGNAVMVGLSVLPVITEALLPNSIYLIDIKFNAVRSGNTITVISRDVISTDNVNAYTLTGGWLYNFIGANGEVVQTYTFTANSFTVNLSNTTVSLYTVNYEIKIFRATLATSN